MEDKQKICDLLLPALQATRNLHDLQELEYSEERELVYAKFESGYQKVVNVAMALLEEDPSWKPGKTGKVYRRLSEMSGDTPSKVERAIRHAFAIVLTEGYLDAVEKYLTLQNTTNGNLLATLYLRLSQEKGKEK